MTETRDESSKQQCTIRQWLKHALRLVFLALLCFVLFKVITLSRDVDVSRRMLKELASSLVKTQRENEDLRKELRHTKAKVEIILRKFSIVQKVSRVHRTAQVSSKPQHKPKCHRVHACLQNFTKEHLPNCTSLSCRPEQKKDFIHLRGLWIEHLNRNWKTFEPQTFKTIAWNIGGYLNNINNKNNAQILDNKHIKFHRNGFYRVYCNLRVGSKYIEEVSIKEKDGDKTLFSSSPTFNSNNSIYEVRLSGLAEIREGTELFVQVKRSIYGFANVNDPKFLRQLFPRFNSDYYDNNFGVFSIT